MYERYCILRDNLEVKDIAIARETGITPSTFSDWKKGKSTPNADKLVKIARCLNTTVEYLVTGENPQPAAPSPFPLSDFERELVRAYRRADDIDQTSVRRTLGIDNAETLKKGETA